MERAEQFALHKRPRSTPNEGDQVTHLPLGNKLPIWGELPLDAKLPFNNVPRGSIQLYTTKLSVPKFTSKQTLDFDRRDPEGHFRPGEYEPLHDPHLKQFFNNPTMRRHLVKEGYVSRDGRVLCTLPQFHQYRLYLRHMHGMQIAHDREIERRLYHVSKDVNANNVFAGRIPYRPCRGKGSRRRRKGQRDKLTSGALSTKLRRLASLLDDVTGEMAPRDRPAIDTGQGATGTWQDRNQVDESANAMGNTNTLGTDPMSTEKLIQAPLCCQIPKVGWLQPENEHTLIMANNRKILQEEVQLIQPPLCCHFPKTGWPQSERERYISMANNKTRKILQAEIQRIDNWTAKQGRQNALLDRARALQQKDYETRFHNVAARDKRYSRDRKRMQGRIDAAKKKNYARSKRRSDMFDRNYEERMAKRHGRATSVLDHNGNTGTCTCGCQCIANLCAALRSIQILPDQEETEDPVFDDDEFSEHPQSSRTATARTGKPRPTSARPSRPGQNPQLKVERAPSMFESMSHLRPKESITDYMERLRQSDACTSFFDPAAKHRVQSSQKTCSHIDGRWNTEPDIRRGILPVNATNQRRATTSCESVPQRMFTATSDVALKRASSMTFAETLLLRLLDDINNDKLTKQEIAALASCAMKTLPLTDEDHEDIKATAKELGQSEAQDSSATALARYMVNFTLSKILEDVKTGAIDDNELVHLTKTFLGTAVHMRTFKGENDAADNDGSNTAAYSSPTKLLILDSSMDDYIFDTLKKVAKDLDSRTLTEEQVKNIANEVEKEMELTIWSTKGDSLRTDNNISDLVEEYRNRVKSTETDLQIMRRIAAAIVESYDGAAVHWADLADTATDLIRSLLSTVEMKVTGGAIKDISVDKVKTTNTILKQDGLNDEQISHILFSIISAVTGLTGESSTMLHKYADTIVSDVISKAKKAIDMEGELSPRHLADKIMQDALLGAEEILHCGPYNECSTLKLLKEVTREAEADEIKSGAKRVECKPEEQGIQKRYDNDVVSLVLSILTNLQIRFSNGEISDHSIAHFFQTISPHDIDIQKVEQYAALNLYKIIDDVRANKSESLFFRGIIDTYLASSDSSELIEAGNATKALESILVSLSADILSKFVKATLENVLVDMKVETESPFQSRHDIPPVSLLRKASSTISVNVVQEVLSRIESPTMKSDVGIKAAQSVSSSLLEHAASSTFQQDARHQAHIKHSRRHTIGTFAEKDEIKFFGQRRMSEPPTANKVEDVVLETLHNTIANLKLESAMRSVTEPAVSLDNRAAVQQYVHDVILDTMETIVIDMQDKHLNVDSKLDSLKEVNECVEDVTECVKDVLKEVLGEMNEELTSVCMTEGTAKEKESDAHVNGMIINHLQRALSGQDVVTSDDLIGQPQIESVRSIILESLRTTMTNVKERRMSQENIRKFHLYLYDFVINSSIDPSLLKTLDEKYIRQPEQHQTTNDMVVELLGVIIEHIESEGLDVQSLDTIGSQLATLGVETESESSLVFSDTALSCESGMIGDLVDEILIKMSRQINSSNEKNHNSIVANSQTPSEVSTRDLVKDDHQKLDKKLTGTRPGIESVAESMHSLNKHHDSDYEEFSSRSYESVLSPSEHSDRTGSAHSGSLRSASFTSSGTLSYLTDSANPDNATSGSGSYSEYISDGSFYSRTPEVEINTNGNRPKSASSESQTLTSKRYNRNTNSGKTIVTFVKESSGSTLHTNTGSYPGSSRTSISKRKKDASPSPNVKQDNKSIRTHKPSLERVRSAERNLRKNIQKLTAGVREQHTSTRISKSSTSAVMYSHIDRLRRVYANTPDTIRTSGPADSSYKTKRICQKKNALKQDVKTCTASSPAPGDQVYHSLSDRTRSKVTTHENARLKESPDTAICKTTPDKASLNVTPDKETCEETPDKARSRETPGEARYKTTPDKAISNVAHYRAKCKTTPDKVRSRKTPRKAKCKTTPEKAQSKLTPGKANRRVTPDREMYKAMPDSTMSKATPDKTKCKVTPEKTSCKVTPEKTRCKVTSETTRCKVTPEKTRCKVTPETTRCKVTTEKIRCKVTPEKTRCKVTPEKIRCKVTPEKTKCKVEPNAGQYGSPRELS